MSDGKRSKSRRILKAIPVDGWVNASDIEEKTGISTHTVGAFISHYLNTSVEKRKTQRTYGGGDVYEYRRLRRIGKINRLERAEEHEPTGKGRLL
ncbi:unnamed protein product [marine sediment metagenome]|uniref:Uncharacterized protein n=1 Tax=marine sediment metagenome TaxID=412755 RepID=X1JP91_9ZZZZ